MATGIEAVAFAMGAFTFVVEAMKVYINGAQTIKSMRQHHIILKQYSREINMEQGHFENTYCELLEDMICPGDSQSTTLHELMTNPEHANWREENLRRILSLRLRAGSVDLFLDAVEELVSILGELEQIFTPSEGKGKEVSFFLVLFLTFFQQ